MVGKSKPLVGKSKDENIPGNPLAKAQFYLDN
jgi:hypothetical protein